MSTIKSKGIVIKEYNIGESDKMITLLLKEYGKLSVYSRGSRKSKSKYLAGSQLFTYSDFVIFKGNNFYSATQIDVIENFYNIRNDYDKLCLSNYCIELLDNLIMESVAVDDILLLLLQTLKAVSKNIIDIKLIYAIFNFKLLQLSGYTPVTSSESSDIYFSKEGVISYKDNYSIKISPTTLYSIIHILNSDIKDLFKFKLENIYLKEIVEASKIFIRYHLDFDLKSLEFINY